MHIYFILCFKKFEKKLQIFIIHGQIHSRPIKVVISYP